MMSQARGLKDPAHRIPWNWTEFVIAPDYYDRILAAHASLPAVRGSILEVGAGCGYVLTHLTSKEGTLGVGIDYDTGALQLARRVGKEAGVNLALMQGDGRQLPFQDESFNFVFSVGVIEHFEPDVADQFLREHVRVARPGAVVAVSVPNRWNPFHSFLKWRLGTQYRFYPERSYSPGELEMLLKRHGLKIGGHDGWGLFWSLWNMPWKWSYYLSAATFRLGLNHEFEGRLSPDFRSRWCMMTMVWGRR